jgi:hypothetical protein
MGGYWQRPPAPEVLFLFHGPLSHPLTTPRSMATAFVSESKLSIAVWCRLLSVNLTSIEHLEHNVT